VTSVTSVVDMPELAEVRWGIIGVGDVCEVKAGPAFQKAEGSKLVAVMRRNADKAKDFAVRHGVPRCALMVQQLVCKAHACFGSWV
jgi:predicted dehydrogenase